MMGANHVSARFAFNDGLDITTAVLARSSITSFIVMLMIIYQGVPRVISKDHKNTYLLLAFYLAFKVSVSMGLLRECLWL